MFKIIVNHTFLPIFPVVHVDFKRYSGLKNIIKLLYGSCSILFSELEDNNNM